MPLSTLLWIVTGILGLVFLFISIKMKGKADQSFSHFAIAGGSLPFFLIFFTEFANIMGVGNFVGHAGKGYANGLSWIFFILGEQGSKIIFALALAGFAGKFFYNTYIEMIHDLIVRDKVTRILGAVLATTIMIAWTGGQAKGFGTIFNVISGANPIPIIILFTAIYIIYTTVGGYHSLVWMDLVLGLMVIVFGSIFFINAFSKISFSPAVLGERLVAMGAAEKWSFAGASYGTAVVNFVTGSIGIIAAQLYWQSCFAAKNAKIARNGLLSSGTIAIIMVIMVAMVGLIIFTLNPNLNPEDAMPWYMQNAIPTYLAVMIFLLILAAGMSSADSNLNSASVLLTNDIVKVLKPSLTDQQMLKIVRVFTVLIGVTAAVVALYSQSILSLFSRAYSMAGGGLVPLLIIGLLWKKRPNEEFVAGTQNSRVTPWGSRVGLVAGAVLSQINALGTYKIFIALGVSALLIIVVSLLTKDNPPDESVVEA